MSEKIQLLREAVNTYLNLYKQLSEPPRTEEEKKPDAATLSLKVIEKLGELSFKLEQQELKEKQLLRAINVVYSKLKVLFVISILSFLTAITALLLVLIT